VPCSDCLPHAQTVAIQQAVGTSSSVASDLDLVVDTKNLFGPQTVSRTISVAPGTSQLTARSRFQSDELWWALPGRPPFAHYDDWFTIRIRPLARPAAEVTLTRTVRQLLAQGQFDTNAATSDTFTFVGRSEHVAFLGSCWAVPISFAHAVVLAPHQVDQSCVVDESRCRPFPDDISKSIASSNQGT